MKSTLAREWHVLRHSAPGRRFQESYELSRREADRSTVMRRVIRLVIAAVALAIGVVLVFIPGPAFLFLALAGALFATESRQVARALDWLELRLRSGLRTLRRWWRRLSGGGKTLSAVAMLVVASDAACASDRVAIGDRACAKGKLSW